MRPLRDGLQAVPSGAVRSPLSCLLGAVLVITFALLLPRTGAAMWAQMSDAELIASSQAIVVGEWLGQSEVVLEPGASPQTIGVIAVSQTLKGNATGGFALVQRPAQGAPRSGSDLRFERGQKGLWLLRAKPGGTRAIYLVDHPQRFVNAETDAARIAALEALIGRK